jgi:hypothetical protein
MIPRVCQAAFLSLWIASGSVLAQGHTEQSCRSACERLDEKMASFVPPNRCECECKDGWARPSANAACKKCPDGFVTFRKRCQHKVAVEDELIQRKLAILQGIKGTTEAINAERRTRYLQLIRDQVPLLAGTAIALALSKDVKALLPETAVLLLELEKAELDLRGCSASESLRANCDNLKNFHGMLRENYDELAGVRR